MIYQFLVDLFCVHGARGNGGCFGLIHGVTRPASGACSVGIQWLVSVMDQSLDLLLSPLDVILLDK